MARLELLVLGALFAAPFTLSAQGGRHYELKWNAATPDGLDRARERVAPLTFEGALADSDRQGLPLFHTSLALPAGVSAIQPRLEGAVYLPLNSAELATLPGMGRPGEEPEMHAVVSYYRKAPVALVDIRPFRRNTVTGKVERLVSFDLVVDPVRKGGPAGAQYKSYPDHSKLASGSWYRFTVDQDGVYAIDRAFLQSLGVDVNGLASDQINLYGNHFAQLPYSNSVERPTDLVINAIEVQDGGDGQFDGTDRILFYATGPDTWSLSTDGTQFRHIRNTYSNTASYFIGIGTDAPYRIQNAVLATDPATHQVNAFNDRQFIERDVLNLIKSGRQFFGEVYDLVDVYNYSFTVPNIRTDAPVTLLINGAARTVGSSTSLFQFSVGSFANGSISIPGVGTGYTGPYANPFTDTLVFNSPQSTLPITVTFVPNDPITSIGYMNYLELNARRDLKMAGDQLMFRDLGSVGTGNVSEFTVDLASQVYRIWEVTDPMHVAAIPYTDGGIQKTFRLATDSLRQFVAFKNNGFLSPVAVGAVPNQDLHATPLPSDLVIVCPPEFMSEAQRLADRRESEGLSVRLVAPQQVFNEFSSGARDATAIKRYMRMLYDRAGTDSTLFPRYLLLFGDGSYDNVSVVNSNQNWIPTYQTANSWDLSKSYTSDDYFGLLDPTEGEYTGDLVDIGIGRLPVSDAQQARQMVDKILNYDKLQLLSTAEASCSTTGDGGASDWRTWIDFISDDQDGDQLDGVIHMSQSDQLATRVENEHPMYNVYRSYQDAYLQVSTPGGERYPEAQDRLRDAVQRGALLVNYIGHGGEVGWAHERLLDNSTILGWTNLDRLPLFMTATCEFSRWDDPARTSAGEYVFLNPNGGGIALMTTTRLAYSYQNFQLSNDFYDNVLRDQDEQGRDQCLGDIYRQTKRQITASWPSQTNHRNFTLLGDPSCRLARPRMKVLTTAITDTLGNAVDTLQALATVRVSGMVTDPDGDPLTDFNGVVIPTVFDKRTAQSTLDNDGSGDTFDFSVRKNIVYRGKATVTNGAFSFTFVVPKDIIYQVGTGRIGYYAESLSSNACGYTNDPLVGGTATGVPADANGPDIALYLNDDRFVQGGITNGSPLLYARIFDENGINTTGNSIGHDLTAVLDANTDNEVVLNDYYEADLDTWKSGKVRYRYSGLSEGTHTLTLKAWDTHNNSSVKTTEFVVTSSEELALEHVLNYPNPFTTHTEFYFEHNRPCSSLEVQVQVFTVSGRLVKTLNRRLTCEGFRAEPLAWDGLDDQGDKLGRGVYVYRLHVTSPEGDKAEKFEKLVILR